MNSPFEKPRKNTPESPQENGLPSDFPRFRDVIEDDVAERAFQNESLEYSEDAELVKDSYKRDLGATIKSLMELPIPKSKKKPISKSRRPTSQPIPSTDSEPGLVIAPEPDELPELLLTNRLTQSAPAPEVPTALEEEIQEPGGQPDIKARREELVEAIRAARGDEAAKKLEESLGASAEENMAEKSKATLYGHTDELFSKSSEKRLNTLKAEKTYLDAMKAHRTKKKTAVGMFLGNFVDSDRMLSKEVTKLKEVWQNAQAEELSSIRLSLNERYARKHTGEEDVDTKRKSERIKGKVHEAGHDAVMRRYDRMYGKAFAQHIVIDSLRAEQNAHAEALSLRGKNNIQKLGERFQKLPPSVRIGLVYGVLTTAGIAATGGSVALVPLALGGSAALVRWREAVLKEKRGKGSKIYQTYSRVVAPAALAYATSSLLVRGGHFVAGSKSRATKSLSKKEQLGIQDMVSKEQIERIAEEWSSAVNVEGKIDRHAKLLGSTASLAAGLLIGHALTHHAGASPDHAPEGPATPHAPVAPATSSAPVMPQGSSAPKEFSDSMSVGETVGHTNINDADKLLGHFADKLHTHDNFKLHSQDTPLAIRKLFDELRAKDGASLLRSDENHAAIQLGFEGKHGLSAVLQPGDKLSYEHGEIILTRAAEHGHAALSQVLIHKDGSLNPLKVEEWGVQHAPLHHHVIHEHSEVTPGHVDATVPPTSISPEQVTVPTPKAGDSGVPTQNPLVHEAPAVAPVTASAQSPDTLHQPQSTSPEVDHQAPPPHVESFDNAPASVKDIISQPGYESVKNVSSLDVFTTPPEAGNAPAELLRQDMFDVMRESGVGPLDNQTIDSYLHMASQAVVEHAKHGTPQFDVMPAVYMHNGHLQVHGGDVSARMMVAAEYHNQHPKDDVVVELPENSAPFVKFQPIAINQDVSELPPADDLPHMSFVTQSDKVVF